MPSYVVRPSGCLIKVHVHVPPTGVSHRGGVHRAGYRRNGAVDRDGPEVAPGFQPVETELIGPALGRRHGIVGHRFRLLNLRRHRTERFRRWSNDSKWLGLISPRSPREYKA